jgi:hypothetical protein
MIDLIILGVLFVLTYQFYVVFLSPYVPSLLGLVVKGAIIGLSFSVISHLFLWMKFPEGESFLYSIVVLFVLASSYEKLIEPVLNVVIKAVTYFVVGVILYKVGQWLYNNWKEAIVWSASFILVIVALFFVFSPV